MRKKLILVSGKARSGKDSFVNELMSDLVSAQALDITGGLKEVVANMFGITLGQLEDMKDKDYFCDIITDAPGRQRRFSARHFLQFIGNEIAPPLLGKFHWCMERQHKMFSVDRDINILCGARQLKEIEYFTKMNPDKEVIVVKLVRLKEGKEYSPISDKDKAHSTETEVDLITKDYCSEFGADMYEFKCNNVQEIKEAVETFKQVI